MKPSSVALLLLAIAAAAVLLGVIFGTDAIAGAEFCSAEPVKASLDKKEAWSCAEFWLNRYQTLLGALLALGAAGIAYRATRQQVMKADEQIRVAISQASFPLVEQLSERIEGLIAFGNDFEELRYAVQHLMRMTNDDQVRLAATSEMEGMERHIAVTTFRSKLGAYGDYRNSAEIKMEAVTHHLEKVILPPDAYDRASGLFGVIRHMLRQVDMAQADIARAVAAGRDYADWDFRAVPIEPAPATGTSKAIQVEIKRLQRLRDEALRRSETVLK